MPNKELKQSGCTERKMNPNKRDLDAHAMKMTMQKQTWFECMVKQVQSDQAKQSFNRKPYCM